MTRPPGFGEEVAVYSVSNPAGPAYDVGLIRSGSTTTTLRFGVRRGSVPPATWQAILRAAELKVRGAT